MNIWLMINHKLAGKLQIKVLKWLLFIEMNFQIKITDKNSAILTNTIVMRITLLYDITV